MKHLNMTRYEITQCDIQLRHSNQLQLHLQLQPSKPNDENNEPESYIPIPCIIGILYGHLYKDNKKYHIRFHLNGDMTNTITYTCDVTQYKNIIHIIRSLKE
jgi:hypothetical protein